MRRSPSRSSSPSPAIGEVADLSTFSSASPCLGLWRGGGGGVRARRRGFGSPSSPLTLGERSCAFACSAIRLNKGNLAPTEESESSENTRRAPYLARQMTELVAPHRETAQAPLCQFGWGLRVKSLALSVCGRITSQEETRDTAMYTGLGRREA